METIEEVTVIPRKPVMLVVVGIIALVYSLIMLLLFGLSLYLVYSVAPEFREVEKTPGFLSVENYALARVITELILFIGSIFLLRMKKRGLMLYLTGTLLTAGLAFPYYGLALALPVVGVNVLALLLFATLFKRLQ